MLRAVPVLIAGLILQTAMAAPAPGQGAPANAQVSFIEPADGATVPPTFHLKFGVKGMNVRKAGEDIFDRSTGHHHLIIDSAPIPQGDVIPFDDQHVHFGKGQTDATLTLKPGPHTIQLQLADGAHSSYGPKLSATIHVIVAEPAKTSK